MNTLRSFLFRARLRYVCLGVLLLLGLGCCVAFAQTTGARPLTTAVHATMSAGQAVVLGLVEGITEYLPVSSTGHLLLTQRLLGIDSSGKSKTAIDAYEICIQAGAILAVLLLYTGRVKSVFAGIVGKDLVGRRLAINIFVAFLPAAIIGYLFDDVIKQHLFHIKPIILAWLVGGVAILFIAKWRNTDQDASLGQQLEQLTPLQSLGIGLLQCVAMWPGISRSLVTIVGGMAVGLSAVAAVEFSFLLGLVTLSAATLFEGMKHGGEIVHTFGIINPLIGFAVSCLSAILAVKWMVGYLNKHGLALFGYYRLALGLGVAALVIAGYLQH